MFCEQCGAPIPEGARFCEQCGAPVEQASAPAPAPPRPAAAFTSPADDATLLPRRGDKRPRKRGCLFWFLVLLGILLLLFVAYYIYDYITFVM